ncbi:GH25 family lysozyme [Ideonella sp. DXS29W]|uniref:GH25 family lysozyme n=1 Tax=Ideonella lacteola TaxID=2984193 RepID=A0ABU9BKV9_9BURK
MIRRCLGAAAGAVLGLALAACDRAGAPAAVALPASAVPASAVAAVSPTLIDGVDLSNWQGQVDFAQLKGAGVDYVFIKASQGATVADADYPRNIQAARAAGLAAGSYHFYVTGDTPQAQFANFSSQVQLQPGDLPPVIDIESLNGGSSAELVAALKQYIGLVEQRYGVRPIIYAGESFANGYLAGLSAYPLWLADYTSASTPKMPSDWSGWTFWQYSQTGRVAGVDGAVDLDRFHGDLDKFRALQVR